MGIAHDAGCVRGAEHGIAVDEFSFAAVTAFEPDTTHDSANGGED
jgi:hypothetical protein